MTEHGGQVGPTTKRELGRGCGVAAYLDTPRASSAIFVGLHHRCNGRGWMCRPDVPVDKVAGPCAAATCKGAAYLRDSATSRDEQKSSVSFLGVSFSSNLFMTQCVAPNSTDAHVVAKNPSSWFMVILFTCGISLQNVSLVPYLQCPKLLSSSGVSAKPSLSALRPHHDEKTEHLFCSPGSKFCLFSLRHFLI